MNRHRREAQDEHRQRTQRQPAAVAIERHLFVEHARMMAAEQEQHRDHQRGPHPPAHCEIAERQRDADHQQRHVRRSLPEHGVGNVAAVELTDRNQIQRRRQQSPPRRIRHRVQVEGIPGRH